MGVTKPVDGIRVEPLSGALGAELFGIDLGAPLDEARFAVIRRALLDHLVIFFPDQHLGPERQRDIAARFGSVDEEPFIYPLRMPALEGHPEVYRIVKEPRDRSLNLGGFWHADVTYRERPNLGSVVYIEEAPTHGGDTLFSNQYLAYETLSEGMKAMLRRLRAVHSSAMPYGGEAARFPAVARNHAPRPEDRTFETSTHARSTTAIIEHDHPVVRRHPESGRRSLYVNRAFTSRFRGMSREESRPLLEFLWRHAERPEFTCRYRWRRHCLGIWDNRCVLHFALNDYYGQRRVMHRISIHEAARPH